MLKYVAGFLFSEDESVVLLIMKNRPEWMAGFLNGIGGKIKEGETPIGAMERECKEETGLEGVQWRGQVILEGPGWQVTFFVARSNLLKQADSLTDERVMAVRVADLPMHPVVPNLRWLIPLCLSREVLGPTRILCR